MSILATRKRKAHLNIEHEEIMMKQIFPDDISYLQNKHATNIEI